MTKEDKELLLRDLCARLPYGVKIRIEYPFLKEEEWHPEVLYGLDLQRLCIANTSIRLEEIKFKPYLFPLSSMTDEQKVIYGDLCYKVLYNSKGLINSDVMEYVNWCYKNHIDINNLIPMGLANDATNKNIY